MRDDFDDHMLNTLSYCDALNDIKNKMKMKPPYFISDKTIEELLIGVINLNMKLVTWTILLPLSLIKFNSVPGEEGSDLQE